MAHNFNSAYANRRKQNIAAAVAAADGINRLSLWLHFIEKLLSAWVQLAAGGILATDTRHANFCNFRRRDAHRFGDDEAREQVGLCIKGGRYDRCSNQMGRDCMHMP